MNGHKIEKMSDIAPFIQKAGKTGESLDLLVKRDKQKIKTKLIPTKDEAEGNIESAFISAIRRPASAP